MRTLFLSDSIETIAMVMFQYVGPEAECRKSLVSNAFCSGRDTYHQEVIGYQPNHRTEKQKYGRNHALKKRDIVHFDVIRSCLRGR